MINQRYKEDILASVEHALISVEAAMLALEDVTLTDDVAEAIERLEDVQSLVMKIQEEEESK